MSNMIETSGKSVQDALDEALLQLNTTIEKVEYEIIEEGSKGFLGIGSKPAIVRVSVKQTEEDFVHEYVSSICSAMGIEADVVTSSDEDNIYGEIKGENMSLLIGRRGETLDALQYLTSLVVNKDKEKHYKINLDIENYRQKREETLTNLAEKLAARVIRTRKPLTLEPMNPYERRVIHAVLQDVKGVETYSIGDEPNRKVVIKPKNNSYSNTQQQ